MPPTPFYLRWRFVMQFILDRAKEPSSWRGAVLFLTALTGMDIAPEAIDPITSIGLGVAGLIGMVTKG